MWVNDHHLFFLSSRGHVLNHISIRYYLTTYSVSKYFRNFHLTLLSHPQQYHLCFHRQPFPLIQTKSGTKISARNLHCYANNAMITIETPPLSGWLTLSLDTDRVRRIWPLLFEKCMLTNCWRANEKLEPWDYLKQIWILFELSSPTFFFDSF